MAEIVGTFEAERWLRDIHDFIAAENPAAAVETVLGIIERAQLLLEFPEAGYRYERCPGRFASCCMGTIGSPTCCRGMGTFMFSEYSMVRWISIVTLSDAAP